MKIYTYIHSEFDACKTFGQGHVFHCLHSAFLSQKLNMAIQHWLSTLPVCCRDFSAVSQSLDCRWWNSFWLCLKKLFLKLLGLFTYPVFIKCWIHACKHLSLSGMSLSYQWTCGMLQMFMERSTTFLLKCCHAFNLMEFFNWFDDTHTHTTTVHNTATREPCLWV